MHFHTNSQPYLFIRHEKTLRYGKLLINYLNCNNKKIKKTLNLQIQNQRKSQILVLNSAKFI